MVTLIFAYALLLAQIEHLSLRRLHEDYVLVMLGMSLLLDPVTIFLSLFQNI